MTFVLLLRPGAMENRDGVGCWEWQNREQLSAPRIYRNTTNEQVVYLLAVLFELIAKQAGRVCYIPIFDLL